MLSDDDDDDEQAKLMFWLLGLLNAQAKRKRWPKENVESHFCFNQKGHKKAIWKWKSLMVIMHINWQIGIDSN